MNKPLARFRACVGVAIATWLVCRPARLESVRWWRSRIVATAIGLTDRQVQDIDRLYQERLLARRRCIERLVEASNRADRLIREGQYEEDTLRQTQEISQAAADERALRVIVGDEIAALLSPDQRQSLASVRPGRVIE